MQDSLEPISAYSFAKPKPERCLKVHDQRKGKERILIKVSSRSSAGALIGDTVN